MIRALAPVVLGLMLAAASCGGTTVLTRPEGSPAPEAIRIQPLIIAVDVEDGVPSAITVELEDGARLLLQLGESIVLPDWDFEHLDGHRRTKTPLFVTYEERPDEFVAVELSD